MKKILTTAFLLLMFINFKNVSALENETNSFTNSQNVTITEERFLELMNAGYTIDDIYSMDQTTYNNAVTSKNDIAITTKYYKTITTERYGNITNETIEISEKEYNNGNEGYSTFASGATETNYKRLTAMITRSEDDSDLMQYKTYLYWKSMPSTRSYDIIGMGFEGNLVNIAYFVEFRNLYTYGGTTYVSTAGQITEFSSGAGAVFKLPTNNISTLCQELTFEVQKNNSNETITELETGGDYSHATSSVSQSTVVANYHANTGGLTLYSAISNKYDNMPYAQVYWSGTW